MLAIGADPSGNISAPAKPVIKPVANLKKKMANP